MSTHLIFIVSAGFALMSLLKLVEGDASYQSVKELQDSIFLSENYSTTIRPVKDQTKPLNIIISFSLVAIVAVDDVRQELITNGFIFLFWDDEINSWDKSDYQGFSSLSPNPSQIWRPRLVVLNTLGDRDSFKDDYSHTFFSSDGDMGWIPGGLFKTYCALKMEKFPFDVQTCRIQMLPIGHTSDSLQFEVNSAMNLAFYSPNPGWDLLETDIDVENVSVVGSSTFSCPTFSFKIKRRSANIILNVILPVIFMSVLNNLVFFIPGESGEKISYAITVLLSLSVFLSMVSTMTPQVSDTVPALTIYLFVLLLSSVLTVAAAIVTVYLQHKEEEEDHCVKARSSSPTPTKFIQNMAAVTPVDTIDNIPKQSLDTSDGDCGDRQRNSGYNKYRLISKHIDKLFFAVVTTLWLSMTIWYFSFAIS